MVRLNGCLFVIFFATKSQFVHQNPACCAQFNRHLINTTSQHLQNDSRIVPWWWEIDLGMTNKKEHCFRTLRNISEEPHIIIAQKHKANNTTQHQPYWKRYVEPQNHMSNCHPKVSPAHGGLPGGGKRPGGFCYIQKLRWSPPIKVVRYDQCSLRWSLFALPYLGVSPLMFGVDACTMYISIFEDSHRASGASDFPSGTQKRFGNGQ